LIIIIKLVYYWYTTVKPITLKGLSVIFLLLSLLILYAELANFIDFKHSGVYDMVYAVATDTTGSYFLTNVII
jgi:ABC-type antimicrobial peptide transport system permease subunit